MKVLLQQYELVQGSRNVMLDFVDNQVKQQLTTALNEFNGSTVRYLLVHTANTYKHWLANFAMQQKLPFTEDAAMGNIAEIRSLYKVTDSIVAEFLERFGNDPDEQIMNTIGGKTLTLTPLQLFTHTITHEFHHKGQIMTMCRLLGHTPPDTDVIRS